jgi:hypothetical protein
MLCAALLVFAGSGCATRERAVAPAPGASGMLVALRDARPVDGGVDLTIDVRPGVTELWRVPSAFRPDNQAILAIHAVVDQARIGDRLRATGSRDETGALRVETLEILSTR